MQIARRVVSMDVGVSTRCCVHGVGTRRDKDEETYCNTLSPGAEKRWHSFTASGLRQDFAASN